MERLVEQARSATLGTIDDQGRPHLVPIVFAHGPGSLYTAIDHKPKSTLRLKRLGNIAARPSVSVLVDHYDDDWTRLWWVRIDGTARIIETGEAFTEALALLTAKYHPYGVQAPPGPVIAVTVELMRGWSAT